MRDYFNQEFAMKLETKKWIKDGQYLVEIKGSLAAEERDLIKEYGDMKIDLSSCKSRKSFSKLSDFSTSGIFANEKGAKAFIDSISKKLKEILKAYRNPPGDFQGREVHDIEGLEFTVVRERRNCNFNLHLSIEPNAKARDLIGKYGNQDIDVSTEKFTSHVQSLNPQSSKIMSLRTDKTFENAVDAYQYRDKIKTQIEQVMKDYAHKKDTFSGEAKAEI